MPPLKQRIKAFSELGKIIMDCASGTTVDSEMHQIILKGIENSLAHNSWFISQHLNKALRAIASILTESKLEKWIREYDIPERSAEKPIDVAVIMPGNIPAVGFHDFLCVLMAGCNFSGKLSLDDPFLIPAMGKVLCNIEDDFTGKISFTTNRIIDADAIIATGSNNSVRYFDYYYGQVPHIFRNNRNGIAVLTGKETIDSLQNLSKDIFMHFGLGCRNVSKLFLLAGYNFSDLLQAFKGSAYVAKHEPYMNNYRLNKAKLTMQNIHFIDNGFVILQESDTISSQVATLHFEYYENTEALNEYILSHKDQIQCIVSELKLLVVPAIGFGETQQPQLNDYADGVDTINFLLNQRSY